MSTMEMAGKPVAPTDYSIDENLLAKVNRRHYICLDLGGFRILRANWVASLIGSGFLWLLVIHCASSENQANEDLKDGQSWVTQNFTWLYISSQNVWLVFLLWLACSKYGGIKLGRDDEKPEFSDLVWFAMLFACGLGIGLYFWGISEPMYYFRGYGAMQKPGQVDDDQRAQQAIFVTLFHWGLHGWVPYIVCAVNLGVVCHRNGYPLCVRYCFQPLLGDKVVNGVFGDVIDGLSIACTTFGVCTSLGMGAQSIAAGFERLDPDLLNPDNVDHLCWIIFVVTCVATLSVLSGLGAGIKMLSMVTFALGNMLLLIILFADNTHYLLNVTVQSVGHYFQWLTVVGFDCEAFQQLNYEIDPGMDSENMLVGSSNHGEGRDSVIQTLQGIENSHELTGNDTSFLRIFDTEAANSDPSAYFGQSSTKFMDYWTIFYWGWWISWMPFVGMFVAKISRGRTIRNVIFGALVMPTAYSFVWFSVFGGLGIKLQRIAELALASDAYDIMAPDCAELGYNNKTEPESEQAIALADAGVYAIFCRSGPDRIYDAMAPYTGIVRFLWVLILVGVICYFITSSDSGSYVDDILSSQGHENPPPIQKVYWAFTEGISAIAMLQAGGNGSGINVLSSLQSVSLIAGLPFTFALCYMCSATLMGCKIALGDADICEAAQWTTGTCDIFCGFEGHKFDTRVTDLLLAAACPFFHLQKVLVRAYGDSKNASALTAGCLTLLYYLFFFCVVVGHASELEEKKPFQYGWAIGWALYIGFAVCVGGLRTELRSKYGIYGSMLEDMWQSILMCPFVLSQIGMQSAEKPPVPEVTAAVESESIELKDMRLAEKTTEIVSEL